MINIMHSCFSDFVFNFIDESHFFLQLIFPKRGNIKRSIKYLFLESRRSLSTLTVQHTLRLIELPMFLAFFSVRNIKNLIA